MAFEYNYCVSLSITHPTIDPKQITKVITVLHPIKEAMAGNIKLDKAGEPIIPVQRSQCSHWLADLHEKKRLYSGDQSLADFLWDQLKVLEPYADLFLELQEDGNVQLKIGWFSITSHSAELLDCEMLRKCGEIGLDLEMNFYSPGTG